LICGTVFLLKKLVCGIVLFIKNWNADLFFPIKNKIRTLSGLVFGMVQG